MEKPLKNVEANFPDTIMKGILYRLKENAQTLGYKKKPPLGNQRRFLFMAKFR